MAVHPLAAQQGLMRFASEDLENRALRNEMTRDIMEEARREEKKRREREKRGGWGRMLGSLGGGLLGAIATGGMSIPLTMLLSGAAGGIGSGAGQYFSGGTRKIDTGKWNIAEDEKTEDIARSNVYARMGTDALMSALSAGAIKKAGGLKKLLGIGTIPLPVKTSGIGLLDDMVL